jgi:hypothetical protein
MYVNPYGANPYAGLEKQLREQLAQIEEMGRQSVQRVQPGYDPAFTQTIRIEVDRYLQERQPAAPQPVQAITAAIEESLPAEDLNFLAGNISALPDFLRSQDGKDLMGMLVTELRKRGSSGADPTPATGAGNTT